MGYRCDKFLLHQDINLGVTVGEKFSVIGDYMEVWCLAFAPTSVSCKHISMYIEIRIK